MYLHIYYLWACQCVVCDNILSFYLSLHNHNINQNILNLSGLSNEGKNCGRGYYYDRNVTKDCLPCPKGSYKPTPGQGLCIPCGPDEAGNNMTTRGTGQISKTACYAVSWCKERLSLRTKKKFLFILFVGTALSQIDGRLGTPNVYKVNPSPVCKTLFWQKPVPYRLSHINQCKLFHIFRDHTCWILTQSEAQWQVAHTLTYQWVQEEKQESLL